MFSWLGIWSITLRVIYEVISIISGTGAAICKAVVLVWCNGRWKFQHILGVSVQNFTQLVECAEFLRSCVWSPVSWFMWFRNGFNKGTAMMQPSYPGLSLVTRLHLWLWPWDKATILPVEKVRTFRDRKRPDRWRAKSTCSSLFFDTKNSSWQVKQLFLDTNVMFYGDCMKICKDFAPNFGKIKNWLLRHDNATGVL
jgi:hypothetical protein